MLLALEIALATAMWVIRAVLFIAVLIWRRLRHRSRHRTDRRRR